MSGRHGQPGGLAAAAGVPPGVRSPEAPRPARAAAHPAARRGSRPEAPAVPGGCARRPERRSSRAQERRRGSRRARAAPRRPLEAPTRVGRLLQPGATARAARAAAAPWPGARARSPSTIHAPGAAPHPPGAAGGRLPRARRPALGAARAPPLRVPRRGHRGPRSRSHPQLPLREHFAKVCEVGFKMAPPRVPGRRCASTCGGGGSRQLQVAPARAPPGGVGSGAGPEPGGGCAPGAGWAAPRHSDPGGRRLPGRCALPAPPQPAFSPPPAGPGPAPGPAAYCLALGGADREVRAERIAMETRGRSRGGGEGQAHAPAFYPLSHPGGAGPRGPGWERRGWGALRSRYQ